MAGTESTRLVLCGPMPPDNSRAKFSAVCHRAWRRYGKRMTIDAFVRSALYSGRYANKALVNFDVIVRWNHRNLRVTVDSQDPQWFMRMRDSFARLISTGTDQPLDARRIRLEIAHNKLGASSIVDSQAGLDQVFIYNVYGLRLVVLEVPEGRITPLGEAPVYLYPEPPVYIPGTIQSELDRNNVIVHAQRTASELKRTLNEVMVPIATRLVKMRENAPDGLFATEKHIQEAMYTAAPMSERHSMSVDGGHLRASLEAAGCPSVSETSNDIAYEYARRVCKLAPTSLISSDAAIEQNVFLSCQQVANEFAARATTWRSRGATRQECPNPVHSEGAIPVELHSVGAPIGAKTYDSIDQHVIGASYEDPYRTGISFGSTAEEAASGTGNAARIFTQEFQERIGEAARSSAKSRSHFICKAVAKKMHSGGGGGHQHHHHHHHQMPKPAAAPSSVTTKASSNQFVAVRTHILNGRPELDVIRVSPIQNLIVAPTTKPTEHKHRKNKKKYRDNCSKELAALGLVELKCHHCCDNVQLLGVSTDIAGVVPSQCGTCCRRKKKDSATGGALPYSKSTSEDTPVAAGEDTAVEGDSGSDDSGGEDESGDEQQQDDVPATPSPPVPNDKTAAAVPASVAASPPPPPLPAAVPTPTPAPTPTFAPPTLPEPIITDLSGVAPSPPPPIPPPRVEEETPVDPPALPPSAVTVNPAPPPPSVEQALARPLPAVGPGKPIERVATERPLPNMPPRGMTLLRVINSSTRSITVNLTASRGGGAPVSSIIAPASTSVDSSAFPYGKYVVDILDSDTGAPVGTASHTYRFTAHTLHALDFSGTGPIKMRVAHAYLTERINPISWFWHPRFGKHGEQPFRGSADTGIYILPSNATASNVDTHHIFVKASADAVKNHMLTTVEDDGFFNGGVKTTYGSFSVPAHANNIGAPLTITRDELNGKMAVKRSDGSDDWAPITNVLQVNNGIEKGGHGSVVFVVDASLSEILGAAKN